MRTLKSLLTIVENDPNKTWRDELGKIQLALNSTKSTVTKYSPTELMLGIRAQSLGMSRLNAEVNSQRNRLELDTIREDASANIQKAAKSEVDRFNRGRAIIKPFRKGAFVFLKNSERNKTKLDRKFKGPFIITAVLENDRYELKSLSGSQRVYKYAHENLRPVPQGHDGLLEITYNLLNYDEAETAPEDVDDVTLIDRDDTLTACSDAISTDSRTITANSDTLSVYSDPETWDIQNEIEIYAEQDNP
ncbi:uncharacterized protein LOC120635750 [Pararge aegeria]|nr:uncharacterized protein LOC120635750 [Pararge aegeria]